MDFVAVATGLFYDEPNLTTSGVSHGIAIGTRIHVLDIANNADIGWALTSEGWLLIRHGQEYGRLE